MRLVNPFFYFRQNYWLRKLGSILLLGLMLQYTFGLHIVYGWNSYTMKQLMKSAITTGSFRHSQIVTLTLPVQQFNHLQDNYFEEDEIEMEGKMYDVISSWQRGDYVTVQAICDDDETSLSNAYQQALGDTKQSLPDKNTACLKSCFSPFVLCAYQPIVQPAMQSEKSRLLHEATTFPVSLYSKVLEPPPRLA